MKYLLSLIIILFSTPSSFAQTESSQGTRGGGDMQALEFTNYGRTLVQDFSRMGGKILPDTNAIKKMKSALNLFQVSSADSLPLDSKGFPKEAVTDLSKKTIQLNRKAWNSKKVLTLKLSLVFHEYLRAAGYGSKDETYELTNSFIKILSSKWDYSETALLDREYNTAGRLRAQIKNGKLSCNLLKNRSFEIAILVNRDSAGINHIIVDEAKTIYSEDNINQLDVGENLFIAYGDDGRTFLQVPMPDQYTNCQFGVLSSQPTPEDVPSVEKIRCCIVK